VPGFGGLIATGLAKAKALRRVSRGLVAAIRQHWAVKLPFFGESTGEAWGRVPFINNANDSSMTEPTK
jgi:hypothetical protein